MKKIVLLCTIVCATQLYSMEQSYYKQLPSELRQEIINKALAENDMYDAIKMLRGLYILQHGISYTNLKEFTRVLHMLSDKFKYATYNLAKNFNIPIAQQYMKLRDEYMELAEEALKKEKVDVNKFNELIKKGLDIDMTIGLDWDASLLIWQALNSPLLIPLLLDAGADPNHKDRDGKTALDHAIERNLYPIWVNRHGALDDAIKLLKERMDKK